MSSSGLLKLSRDWSQAGETQLTPAQRQLYRQLVPGYQGDFSEFRRGEFKKYLQELKSKIAISPAQTLRLLELTNLDELRQILKREQVYLTQISLTDYERIVQIKTCPETIRLFTVNHPLKMTADYEFGWQESPLCAEGKMYYLRFDRLAMLDLDSDHRSLEERQRGAAGEVAAASSLRYDLTHIEQLVLTLGLSARVYKTYNGYHLFITSEALHYSDPRLETYTQIFKADIYYRIFCQRYGYKIRLNPKLGRPDSALEWNRADGPATTVAVEIARFGVVPEDPQVIEWLAVHDHYLRHWRAAL